MIQIGKSVAFMEGKLIANDGTVLATASTTARLVEAAKALTKEALRSGVDKAPAEAGYEF